MALCTLQLPLDTLEIEDTLEVFSIFTGLRMNKDKTKQILIGCKKHVKEKLNTVYLRSYVRVKQNLV